MEQLSEEARFLAIHKIKTFEELSNCLLYTSKMILQDELPLTAQNRIKGLILLREQVRELIDFQMEDYS